MSSFTNKLIVSPMTDGKHWRLEEPFSYYVDTPDGEVITVPEGFITDFASVPRIFWSIISSVGKKTKAAVLHDYLYKTKIKSRKESDKIFLQAMKVAGVNFLQRTIVYTAVRWFGFMSY